MFFFSGFLVDILPLPLKWILFSLCGKITNSAGGQINISPTVYVNIEKCKEERYPNVFQCGRIVIYIKDIYGNSGSSGVSLWISISILTFYRQNVLTTCLKLKDIKIVIKQISLYNTGVRTETWDVIKMFHSSFLS